MRNTLDMPLSRTTSLLSAFLIAATACGGDSVVNPPPSTVTIAIVSGNNQTATPGSVLPTPLTVSLTDEHGPVVGQSVHWKVASGNGTLSAPSVLTDATGQASVAWTLGTDEVNEAVASVGNFGVVFSATVTPIQPPPPSPQPIILHFDGVSWSSSFQSTYLAILAVWGASESDVFAGSACLSGNQALIFRYSGTSWSSATPCGSVATTVTSISGNGSNDVFAIERIGMIQTHTYVLHYDGQAWNTVYTHGTPVSPLPDLRAIASRATNDVIAVGKAGMIVRYDGANWNSQASGTTADLNAVWGDRASSAVFAVGASGTILSYDGSAWHTQTSGTTQALYAIWGTSASNVFAAGASGTILHYDGTSWSSQNSGTTRGLRGLWADSPSSVVAVGDASTILRYDGTSWTSQDPGASLDFGGVWGSSPTNVFAVGTPTH